MELVRSRDLMVFVGVFMVMLCVFMVFVCVSSINTSINTSLEIRRFTKGGSNGGSRVLRFHKM